MYTSLVPRPSRGKGKEGCLGLAGTHCMHMHRHHQCRICMENPITSGYIVGILSRILTRDVHATLIDMHYTIAHQISLSTMLATDDRRL